MNAREFPLRGRRTLSLVEIRVLQRDLDLLATDHGKRFTHSWKMVHVVRE